ncbi:ScbA/BarX family gamma-butyrolactone biosynthesis protein [Streptomyces sp. Wb2n-11]|uniref:ScbA/BarX family gamma-butyrolactone biosynthesis protein n=1 Tax=Streptomyces sp. Wb2n-11 TaxID=1030533 RepID=UPI000B0D6060|nr:ScbA/BarX family gamma-butyrolactone biosynthesis protein [Streptomyces sp. Wb2n-11]
MSNSLLADYGQVERRVGIGVLKKYVHLHREEAVLLTGWSSRGSDRYTVTARWPAAAGGPFEPSLVTQTIRQSCLVVAHAERSVPLAHQTLMERLDFSLDRDYRVPRDEPVDLTVEVSCRSTGHRSMRVELVLLHAGRPVGESVVDFSWIAPAVYRRLRGEHLHIAWDEGLVPAPVPAPAVGRTHASDVVLAPTGWPGRWQLRTDVGNVALYDHPVDHVPGLVLIEAACQAAQAVTGPAAFRPVEVASTYAHYIEFDAPCWIDAAVVPPAGDGVTRVEVTGVQDGRAAFSLTLASVA